MIFSPRFPSNPPQGRIDDVVYYGFEAIMADWHPYCVDIDTGAVQFVEPSELDGVPPSGAAGGGLTGTYPNPTVAAVPDSALSGNIPRLDAGSNEFDGTLVADTAVSAPLFIGAGNNGYTGSLADAIAAGAYVAGGIVYVPA